MAYREASVNGGVDSQGSKFDVTTMISLLL